MFILLNFFNLNLEPFTIQIDVDHSEYSITIENIVNDT